MLKHSADILAVAVDYGARLRKSGGEWIGPCPVCGGTDRFSINIAKGLFNCRRCCKGGDVVDLVMHIECIGYREAADSLGVEDAQTRARRRAHWKATHMSHSPASWASSVADNRNATISALSILSETKPPDGSPVWTYLFSRGADLGHLPNGIDASLRWHPSCPFESGRRPCVVAVWRDILTNEVRAIHRRPISCDGKAAGHWRALGPTAGCAIKLWPDDTVSQGLVLAEGPETALVAATRMKHKGTLLQPMWAAGDARHVASFPVLPGIDSLTLLVDHDDAGQKATAQCAARWTAAGRECIRLTPRIPDADFADLAIDEVAA